MTYQGDPNRDHTGRRPQDYIRRDDGSWSPVALVLGAVLLMLIGWFILSDRTAGPNTTTTGVSTPSTSTGGSSKTPQEKK